LRGIRIFAWSDGRGWCEPGSWRCVSVHALSGISSGQAGCRDAAPACGGIQSGRCLRDRRLAL